MKKNFIIVVLITVLIISIGFNLSFFKKNLAFEANQGDNIRLTIQWNLRVLPSDYTLLILSDSKNIDVKDLLKLRRYYDISRLYTTKISMKDEIEEIENFVIMTDDNLKHLYKLIENNENQETIDNLVEQIKSDQQKCLNVYNEIEQLYSDKYMNDEDNGFFMGADKTSLNWFKLFNKPSEEMIQILKKLNQ